MSKILFAVTAGVTLMAGSAGAQVLERHAVMTGGANPNGGKCTIEVVVDEAAEVEIRGDTAILRTLAGQPPQWRRFQCDGVLPSNPTDFRFRGIDGRGRQELVRDPRDGSGIAVIRIEDPPAGAEGYTFDIMWSGYGNANPGDRRDFSSGPHVGSPPFATDRALDICRNEVRRQAAGRFGTPEIDFREIRMDDNPGRREWVVGTFFLRRDRDRDEPHRFACSVDFNDGRVRSVEIDAADRDYDRGSAERRGGERVALDSCQQAVADRIRQRGYGEVNIDSIRIDDRPGRDGFVVGTATARRGRDFDSYNFSCSIDTRDGDVRSVEVDRR
jgi:hypothetical protein